MSGCIGTYRTSNFGQDLGVDGPGDVRLSFNEVPEIYDAIRPGYPAELYDVLFGMLPDDPEILEVGAGTGQATKDLLARGASVHAVEIGPATAAMLRSKLPSDRLRVSVADFEELALPPASDDCVFSASAYHWISPAGQTNRPARLLRTGGVVAIVDVNQVASSVDRGFFAAAQPIYERYGQGHKGPPSPTREEVDPPLRQVFEDDHRFHRVAVRRWDWDQTYTAPDYRKLMLSYSVTQMMTQADRSGLLDDIESFINQDFGGHVTRPLVATLTTAVLL
jgi:SAM-dependent methyltransferase